MALGQSRSFQGGNSSSSQVLGWGLRSAFLYPSPGDDTVSPLRRPHLLEDSTCHLPKAALQPHCSHTVEPPSFSAPGISDWGCKCKNGSPGPRAWLQPLERSTGTLQVSFQKSQSLYIQPRVEGCHGGSQDFPLHSEGVFLPSRYAKSQNIKQNPQGTRLRDSCEQPLLLPHMGSRQLHCLWLQKLSLFTFVLKLHPAHTRSVSVTQNTVLPQPAPLCSTWLPAATLHSCRSCKNQKHLPSTETLASSETGIPSGLLLYLYWSSLPSRSSQDLRNARPRLKLKTAPSSSLL